MAMQTPTPRRISDSAAEQEGLSALLDGESDVAQAMTFTRRWRTDGQLQRDWDTYHLIGDALRSEDLCRQGSPDRFMTGLRERLAAEPVVLAPTPLPARARRNRWMRPMSAAAGVVAVAGSVWLLPVRQGLQNGPALATAPTAQQLSPTAAATAAPAAATRSGAHWNRYLAAHQQFPSGAGVVPVSGYLRQADYESTGR